MEGNWANYAIKSFCCMLINCEMMEMFHSCCLNHPPIDKEQEAAKVIFSICMTSRVDFLWFIILMKSW
jgi:hypothetical protein